MRYTEKINETNYKLVKYNDFVRACARQKLGKLEDMEKELGFDLEKLQETNYIYAEDWENVLRKYEFIGVNFKEKKIWFWYDFQPMYLSFESYKKTFWLKEDKSE